MKSLASLFAACALYGALTVAAKAATECIELVMPMRALQADVRSGIALTPAQQDLWRTWNQACQMPMWQAELVREGAPVQSMGPAQPPAPEHGWRDVAIAVLQGMERGVSGPVCTTRLWGRGPRAKYVTSCY
jgi:hypothetical protein